MGNAKFTAEKCTLRLGPDVTYRAIPLKRTQNQLRASNLTVKCQGPGRCIPSLRKVRGKMKVVKTLASARLVTGDAAKAKDAAATIRRIVGLCK